MTVSVPGAVSFEYSGDGASKDFSFPLRFLEGADLRVTVDGAVKALGSNYSVLNAGNPAGGTVRFVIAPAGGSLVRIERRSAPKQTVDLADGSRTPGDTLEGQLDRLTMVLQEHDDRLSDQTDIGDAVTAAEGYAAAAAASAASVDQYPDTGGTSPFDGLAPAVISRARPAFLTPEMYMGLETQLIYCPSDDPNDWSGATDWAPAFDAMHEEMTSRLKPGDWLPADYSVHDFGVAFMPGHRYKVTRGVNFTRIPAIGLTVHGFGATVCGAYQGGAPLLDMIGSMGWRMYDLNCESDNQARPSFGRAYGRHTRDSEADNMVFTNCRIFGWWQIAASYNLSSECSTIIGGEMFNYYEAGPAHWIDSRNAVNMALYTQAEDFDVPVNSDTSTLEHTIIRANLRAYNSIDGALKITSAADIGMLSRVADVYLDNCYLTNSTYYPLNSASPTERRPAIYVKGCVDNLRYSGKSETNGATAYVDLSHEIFYDTTEGAVTQFNHQIEVNLLDADQGVIGSDGTNDVKMLNADIRVAAARGTHGGVAAPLFHGASKIKFQGKVAVGAVHSAFLNFSPTAYADVELSGEYDPANVTLKAIDRVKMRNVDGTGREVSGVIQSYRNDAVLTPQVTIEQDGTGDANLQWYLTGLRAWVAGVDQSDSNAFKLSGANDSFATWFLRIGTSGFMRLNGSFSRGAPVTKIADFTLTDSENWIINNKAGSACVVTLPSASGQIGREIMFLNRQAQQVNSASSNVVPQAGGAAAAAILPATVGAWAVLVSDGTSWLIMRSGL